MGGGKGGARKEEEKLKKRTRYMKLSETSDRLAAELRLSCGYRENHNKFGFKNFNFKNSKNRGLTTKTETVQFRVV
uniref:Uncharacterized protein n=1 Tax=Oryza brachyantha TaxID=4533 RepID=J3MDC3_ORYBR